MYFGWADLAGYAHHPSIIFIGAPTTLGDRRRRVEAHLLDIPDKDYYDLPMSVTLGKYHRANRTFAGADELVEAMKADETAAREWFKERGGTRMTIDVPLQRHILVGRSCSALCILP